MPIALTRAVSGMAPMEPFVPDESQQQSDDHGKYERYHPETILPPVSSKFLYNTGPPPSISEMDFKRLDYSEPRKMAFGYKVNVTYDGKPLTFQTPKMCCTFGLNVYKNKRGDSKVMELDFYHRKHLDTVNDFYKTCRMLDKHTLDNLISRRDEWVPQLKKSRVPNQLMWQKYNGITRKRESKDGQLYDPRITVKVWDDRSTLFPQAWGDSAMDTDEDVSEISTETLPPKTWVVGTIVCTGLWLCRDSATLAWRLDQARVVSEPDYMGPALSKKNKMRLVF